MNNKLERAMDELRDALAFGGDVPGIQALVPVLSALNRKDQEVALPVVVGVRRVDLVRALEPVEWKINNWKYSVVHHAAILGCVDIVADMASEVDSLSLQYCLCGAAQNPTPGQMEIVRLLAPMVHAGKRPMVHAIRDALLSIHYGQPLESPPIPKPSVPYGPLGDRWFFTLHRHNTARARFNPTRRLPLQTGCKRAVMPPRAMNTQIPMDLAYPQDALRPG